MGVFRVMFKVYKSPNPFDFNNMPSPIAENITDKSYTDTDVKLGDRFYYCVSATKNGVEKFSDVVIGVVGEIDDYFNYVELLIFADASSFPSSVFVDSSSKQRVISKVGNPLIVSPSVVTPKFDAGSIYFGKTQLSTLNTSLSSPPRLSDFTIEMHVYLSANPVRQEYMIFNGRNNIDEMFALSVTSSRQIYVEMIYRVILTGPALTVNTWNHVCVMRKNGVFYLFINGNLSSSTADYNTNNLISSTLTIGNTQGASNTNQQFSGYLSSIRVTQGVARYATTGFTPPSAKYPH